MTGLYGLTDNHYFDFNGGTLQAGGGSTGFFGNLTSALVQAGGAKIDTQDFGVTVTQSLAHDGSLGATVDGGLTKLGTGTLILTSGSSYTGGTTVRAGTLLAANPDGSATGTGAVVVQSSAVFGGTGASGGSLTVQSGGTLAPGINGPGRLTLASTLSLNPGARLAIELGGLTAGTQYDQLSVSGQLTLGGNLRVGTVNGFTLAVGQTFVILDNVGSAAVSGTFANTTAGGLYTDAAGDTFLVNYLANADGGLVPNDVTLTVVSVVPEPGT